MKELRAILSFLSHLSVLTGVLVVEYPLGAPLLTVTLGIIWFSHKGWLYQLLMSACLSLAVTLIFSLSWMGVYVFFLGCFWFAQNRRSRGWPEIAIVFSILLLAILGLQVSGVGLFATSRATGSLFWHVLLIALLLLLFSKSSRRQLLRIWRGRHIQVT